MSPQHCHAHANPARRPQRRLYDKGYDADASPGWLKLKQRAIEGEDGEPTRPS